jgi:HIV Tat-specific factor 1
LAEQQQAIYAVSGVDEREPAGPVKKKRKKIYTSNDPEVSMRVEVAGRFRG